MERDKSKPSYSIATVDKKEKGRYGLHTLITDEELERACALIRTGRASVEAAIIMQRPTSTRSIWRSKETGEIAAEKFEMGEDLTDREIDALRFFLKISQAMAEAEIRLTRQALGDADVIVAIDPDGTVHRANAKCAPQALTVLQITRSHWRPPKETKVEVNATVHPTTMSDEELRAAVAAAAAAMKGR